MCNIKLNNSQVKRQTDDFGVEDDLFIWWWLDNQTKGEKHSNIDLHGAFNNATLRNDNEDESDEKEIDNDAKIKSQGSKDNFESYWWYWCEDNFELNWWY